MILEMISQGRAHNIDGTLKENIVTGGSTNKVSTYSGAGNTFKPQPVPYDPINPLGGDFTNPLGSIFEDEDEFNFFNQ